MLVGKPKTAYHFVKPSDGLERDVILDKDLSEQEFVLDVVQGPFMLNSGVVVFSQERSHKIHLENRGVSFQQAPL